MTHKYRAKPQRTDDGYFPSKKELKRWNELKLLEKAGAISHLTRNTKETTFHFIINGTLVCKYQADAVYKENGKRVVEDTKSKITKKNRVYIIKRKLMKACFDIEIKEV